jgi:Flp pilus assembly protein TadD
MRPILLSVLFFAPWTAFAADSAEKALCQKNLSTYKDRIHKNVEDESAWTELRVCATELKKWDEAIQIALQARLKNRHLSQPYLILGLAQMQQKNYERAIEHFDQTIELRSSQPVAYFQMGMAYLFLNEPGKAAQAAERAVDLEPTNPVYHRQLAYTLLIVGELEAAETSIQKAITLDPKDIAAHKILAKIYTKAGNTAGAAQAHAWIKAEEAAFAAAHPELVKKPEVVSAPKPEARDDDEEEDEKKGKEEDYQLIGQCIGQWDNMKLAIDAGDLEKALLSYSDYLDTRELYRESFNKLGSAKLKTIFKSFSELYDCEVIFATAHCKAMVHSPSGAVVVTKIRFERNPDKVWRIRSY